MQTSPSLGPDPILGTEPPAPCPGSLHVLGRCKRTLQMPSPREDLQRLCLASPAMQTASLPASAITSPCWAGFGVSVPPLPKSHCCWREVATSLVLFPRATSRHRGSQQGPPLQGIPSWGGGDPHLLHLPAPLCPSPAPDVHVVGHMSGMLQCQAGWLLAWHKPRELSSRRCHAAKHQAFSISLPQNPSAASEDPPCKLQA